MTRIIKKFDNDGVSSVLGEFLMICLALVLVAVFAASLSTFVPEDRDPTVTFLVEELDFVPADAVTIWHKGGDGLMKSSIIVIFSNDTYRFPTYDSSDIIINDDENRTSILTGDKIVVDLGDERLSGDEVIQIATSRAVIFNGRVYYNG